MLRLAFACFCKMSTLALSCSRLLTPVCMGLIRSIGTRACATLPKSKQGCTRFRLPPYSLCYTYTHTALNRNRTVSSLPQSGLTKPSGQTGMVWCRYMVVFPRRPSIMTLFSPLPPSSRQTESPTALVMVPQIPHSPPRPPVPWLPPRRSPPPVTITRRGPAGPCASGGPRGPLRGWGPSGP
jgi:hypothetical protein